MVVSTWSAQATPSVVSTPGQPPAGFEPAAGVLKAPPRASTTCTPRYLWRSHTRAIGRAGFSAIRQGQVTLGSGRPPSTSRTAQAGSARCWMLTGLGSPSSSGMSWSGEAQAPVRTHRRCRLCRHIVTPVSHTSRVTDQVTEMRSDVREPAMTLGSLTDPGAVQSAAEEHDAFDQSEDFLAAHGFGAPDRYYVQVEDRLYPAKAIAGVALGYQHPDHGPLPKFSGGEAGANAALRRLGFAVFNARPDTIDGERLWRLATWRHVCASANDGLVRPGQLRELGAYGGAQGIWVDLERTKALHSDGIAVAVLHTGVHYPDDFDDSGVLYHYPSTNRGPRRDASEVAAMKAAADLRVPVFVISKPTPKSSWREVRLGWIKGWAEASRVFLIKFGEEAPQEVEREDRSEEEPFRATGNRSRRVNRTVRERPDQQTFKLRVLQRYGPRCPLSGVAVVEMLDAAHLIPDAENGTADPRNGLPLNAALHRAFDAGLFAINPQTLCVETRPGGPTLEDLGIREGSLSALSHKPHLEALQWRYDRWQAGN